MLDALARFSPVAGDSVKTFMGPGYTVQWQKCTRYPAEQRKLVYREIASGFDGLVDLSYTSAD